MDTIQKKPQEMEISLRKNGAFKLNRVFRYKREREKAVSVISVQEIGAHREEKTRGLTHPGIALIRAIVRVH